METLLRYHWWRVRRRPLKAGAILLLFLLVPSFYVNLFGRLKVPGLYVAIWGPMMLGASPFSPEYVLTRLSGRTAYLACCWIELVTFATGVPLTMALGATLLHRHISVENKLDLVTAFTMILLIGVIFLPADPESRRASTVLKKFLLLLAVVPIALLVPSGSPQYILVIAYTLLLAVAFAIQRLHSWKQADL